MLGTILEFFIMLIIGAATGYIVVKKNPIYALIFVLSVAFSVAFLLILSSMYLIKPIPPWSVDDIFPILVGDAGYLIGLFGIMTYYSRR